MRHSVGIIIQQKANCKRMVRSTGDKGYGLHTFQWQLTYNVHVALQRYDGLRLLEREANVTVFPFIEVESEMENKDRYLQHIIKSPNYLPLDKKLELGDAYIPPPMPKAASSFSPSFKIEVWNGFQYSITRGSNLLAPTVLIHTDELANKESELLLFLSHLLQLLQFEINEFGWKAEEGVWIIKGTNSTRTNVLKRFRTVKEALIVIKEASQQGMKLVNQTKQ